MSGHKGRRGGGHEEEHENHERWLISYADMITLLMVLFVVMFAISNVDQKKFAELSAGLSAGFGAPRFVAMDGAISPLSGAGPMIDPISVEIPPVGPPGGDSTGEVPAQEEAEKAASDLAAAQAELARLDDVEAQAQAALAAVGLQDRAGFRVTEEGLVVVLFADDVFFANGSATIQPTGERVIDTLGPVLLGAGSPVSAEGHANHLPVGAGSIYPSNWELSAARAAAVARRLVEVEGLPASTVDATGYGDARPLVPIADPASLTTNRRVDLLLRSNASPEVRALLPTLDATRS
ncbi:flagellar motor protein MotB [Aquipuribacter hungaricus]|uniref:Flagellar motor protein MotB n=1 Tax=Aquipuribacter hungaricus TaxID=545624 RepID=A0ABV7WIQ4_9MICO